MTQEQQQKFIETYVRIFNGGVPQPRVALAQALTVPRPANPLIKKGERAASPATVNEIRNLLLSEESTIETILVRASKAGGFTGAFFELLWLCEEEPAAPGKPALDPGRSELTPMQRRKELARELRAELVRIAQGNREGKRVARVFVRGRFTTLGYKILYDLLNTRKGIGEVRLAVIDVGTYFHDEFRRRLEECK